MLILMHTASNGMAIASMRVVSSIADGKSKARGGCRSFIYRVSEDLPPRIVAKQIYGKGSRRVWEEAAQC